jgi:putative transposase
MRRRNPVSEGYLYFVTLTVTDWIDVFTRAEYKYIILDSLKHCQKEKGLEIYSWCLMKTICI